MGAGHDHGTHGVDRHRLIAALSITLGIFLVEVAGAAITGSLALLIDAAHMLTDCLGLMVALTAAMLAMRPPSTKRTWGWQRAEVIAAALQAAVLLGVGCYAIFEGIQRLINPPQVAAGGLAFVGVLGLLGNIASLFILAGGRGNNLNMRAAFLEVTNDALGSVAVLVAAAIIATTNWLRADAVVGLLVAALIVPRAVILLRESGAILLESTPEGLDLEQIRKHILTQPHVVGVHDLHASTVASGLPVMTAHVVMEEECFTDQHCLMTLAALQESVAHHYSVAIEHCTFQLESPAIAATHEDHLHV